MSDDQSFFLKKITQTDYRGNKPLKDREDDENPYVDLSLPPQKQLTLHEKTDLKEKIKTESDRLVDTILPEDIAITVKKTPYLKEVFHRLELS